MASRVSLIQSRSIYVGTLNSVAPSDGNLIVSGNVGIGTTAPLSLVHASNGNYRVSNETASTFRGYVFGATAGDSTEYSYLKWEPQGGELRLWNNPAAFGGFFSIYTNAVERMRITSGGNVGIGTTNPISKLHVAGSTYVNGGTLFIDSGEFLRWGNSNQGIRGVNDTSLEFVSGGSERMRITNTGNVGIGTTAPNKQLTLKAPASNYAQFALAGGDTSAFWNLYAFNDNSSFNIAYNGTTSILSVTSAGAATFSSSVTASSLIKSGGTSAQYLMADGSVSTTSNVAPRYVQTINVSQTGYTTICTVTGGSLASAVNMSFQGTSGNVVVNVTAQILVNHFQDISITTTSGFYTQLNIRVISNNNETYSVEAQVVSAQGQTTDLNIEVFPLNSESVTFGGSPVTPGTTLVHTTRQGLYVSASESMSISSGSDIYAAGNVGVGTTSPSSKLHVVGDILASAASGNRSVVLTTNNANAALNTIAGTGAELATDGTNQNIAFRTGVSTRMYIKSDGSVGIGTTNPIHKLEVAGNISINGGTYLDFANGDVRFVNSSGLLSVQTYSVSTGLSTKMVVTGAGNVGIGTTAPTVPLQIVNTNATISMTNSTAFAVDTGSRIFLGGKYNTAGTTTPFAWLIGAKENATDDNQAGYLSFTTTENGGGFAERMRITSTGNVGIGTTSPARKLQVEVGSTAQGGQNWSHSNGTVFARLGIVNPGVNNNTEFGSASNNDLVLLTVNAEKMRITTAGNVGIGTTSPGAKLFVQSSVSSTEPTMFVQSGTGAGQYGMISTGDSFHGIVMRGKPAAISTYEVTAGDEMSFFEYGGIFNFYQKGLSFNLFSRIANGGATYFNGGNVGIGTTSPNNTLEVAGSLGSGKSTIRITNTDTGNYATIIAGLPGTSNAGMSFATDGTSKMVIDASGEVGIGTVLPMGPLEVYKANTGGLGGHIILNNNGQAVGNETAVLFNDSGVGSVSSVRAAISSSVEGSPYYGDLKFKTGATSYGSLNTRMIITGAGNVGIGTTSPGYKLDVVGDTRITSGSLGVGVAPNATDGRIDASNDIVAYQTSDQRLKENVTPIENALEKVKSLTGVEFDWIEEHKHIHGYEGHDTGIIAQQVQAVMPTAVRTNDSGYLSVRYEKMIALLIEGMKEQQKEIDELKKLIK
jgi:hypothetical protein